MILIFVVLMAAQSWDAAKELPGIDMAGLNPDQQLAALKVLREESCNCGCSMKIAECRFKDPQCSYSRALALEVVKDLKAGKTLDQVRAIASSSSPTFSARIAPSPHRKCCRWWIATRKT